MQLQAENRAPLNLPHCTSRIFLEVRIPSVFLCPVSCGRTSLFVALNCPSVLVCISPPACHREARVRKSSSPSAPHLPLTAAKPCSARSQAYSTRWARVALLPAPRTGVCRRKKERNELAPTAQPTSTTVARSPALLQRQVLRHEVRELLVMAWAGRKTRSSQLCRPRCWRFSGSYLSRSKNPRHVQRSGRNSCVSCMRT